LQHFLYCNFPVGYPHSAVRLFFAAEHGLRQAAALLDYLLAQTAGASVPRPSQPSVGPRGRSRWYAGRRSPSDSTADDVAAIVADLALAAPRNGIVEIADPEGAAFASGTPCGFERHRLMKASRSGFTTSACVVHMPCGNFS
jgi:hypothetical protein